jgi:hypothetical protein
VLLVPLEFARWQRARSWSYAAGLGLEEGLEAHGFSCTVLPALSEYPSISPRSWLYHAPRLLDGERFDQVWVWMTHTAYDPVFLEWVKGVAPVRVGIVMESMDYTPAEYAVAPHLLARRDFVETQLRVMTHVLAMDEVDAAGFDRRLDLPAMWLPTATPTRTLRRPAGSHCDAPAIFIGDLYGHERAALLDHAGLRSLIVTPRLPENDTSWPERFDALQRDTVVSLGEDSATADGLAQHVASLRVIRRALFDLWLDGVRLGSASVNLPSLFKGYSGRVVESMGAGVPVVSWDAPHRPANRSLFTPGREIRLFERSDAEALAGHLRDLRSDPAMARAQAEAAFHVVEQHHTAERRVEQILGWIASGVEPLRQPGEPARPKGSGRSRWWLPDTYCRREEPARIAAAGAGRSEGYPLAVELASAIGCTRLVDVGCPEPASCVRAAVRLETVALCASEVARAYERRCPHIEWRVWDQSREEVTCDVTFDVPCDGQTLILCVMQLERAVLPNVLAGTLARLLGGGAAGLIVSVERERTWGTDAAGPPPQGAHLQEWSASARAAMLCDAGIEVLHQSAIPADAGRRELTCVATVVMASGVASGAAAERRTAVTTAASTVIDAFVRDREAATSYELFEAGERVRPVFVISAAANAIATPTLQALLSDDRWLALHSARAPVEEATRWVERLEVPAGAPVVLFGLGLGYQALALLGRPGAGRVIVVDPFADVVARAREVAATRQALDHGRIEIVDSWEAFKRLAGATPLDLSAARFLSLPVYQRLADEDYATSTTLFTAAMAWARAGLELRCKPFFHPDGISVVISTFDRIASAIALVERIARQQPCGAAVEILLVNDHGTGDVFAAAREIARQTGAVLRTFDTRYTGYGLTLARNIGLRQASYRTTVFLDDDLEVGVDLLRRYHEAPEGVRMGRIDFTFESAGVQRQCPDRRIALQGPDRVLRPWSAFEGFMWGGNCAVPTELGLALGGFDETFLGEGEEDLDFSVRAVAATHRPVAVPSALATHQGLDRNGRVWLGFERFTRPGRANDRLADPTRGSIVNGGIEYWASARWNQFEVE